MKEHLAPLERKGLFSSFSWAWLTQVCTRISPLSCPQPAAPQRLAAIPFRAVLVRESRRQDCPWCGGWHRFDVRELPRATLPCRLLFTAAASAEIYSLPLNGPLLF